MTQTPPQNPTPPPPPPKKPTSPATRLALGTVLVAVTLIPLFYLVTRPALSQLTRNQSLSSNHDLRTMICLTLGTILLLTAAYVVLRFAIVRAVKTIELIRAGGFSGLTLLWLTAGTLGAWGLVMLGLIYTIVSDVGDYLFGGVTIMIIFFLLPTLLLFLLFNPLVLVVIIRYTQARRRVSARLLLIQAAGMVDVGMDPVRVLGQVQPGASYINARRQAISQAMEQNLTFAQAINQNVPSLTKEDKALLLAAERMGVLGPVLLRKSQDLQREDNNASGGLVPTLIITEWAFLSSIGLFMMIFIVPKFERIYEDFGSDLPALTKLFMYTTKYLMGTMPDQSIPGIFQLLLLFVMIPVVLLLLPFIKRALGYLAVETRIPVISHLVFRSNLAVACLFLAHTLRAGIDLPSAVAQTRTLGLNPAIDKRLLAWETHMRAGLTPGDAAQKAGLPPVMAAFIRAAQSGPAMGDAMDRLARYYQTQTSRTRIVLETLAMPVMVLITGIIVGSMVIGWFIPMVKLISKLT